MKTAILIGIAVHLIGADPERLTEPTAAATGPLIETFAANRLEALPLASLWLPR